MDFCIEQGVGLDGLVGSSQLLLFSDSLILVYEQNSLATLWPLLDQPVILGSSQDRSCSPKCYTGDPGSKAGMIPPFAWDNP